MIPRTLSLLAALVCLAAPPALAAPKADLEPATSLSAQDQALVQKAAAYLDGLKQMRGRFVQTDARGRMSAGELYLDRPGKARFEYGSPPQLLVISNGNSVGVYDQRLKTADRYPLAQTPLSLFLQKHVSLDQKVVVTGVQHAAGGFSITLRDSKHRARGEITLSFSDQPMAIREWSVVDAQGGRTTVRLSDLRPVSGLDPKLFVLPDPQANAPR